MAIKTAQNPTKGIKVAEKSSQSNFSKRWLRAIGFYRGFLLVSFMPVSLGATVAWWSQHVFFPGLFALTLAAVWAVHIGANLINDYYDHISGTDDINEVRTPFSGGTRVIQESLLPPKPIKIVGYSAFVAGGALLIALALLTGWPILALAALGIGSSIAYSAKPVWLSYRGLGEFVLGLNFGPFLVLTAYYVQAKSFPLESVTAGLIMGLFSSAIITINEVPDIEADQKTGKYNLVARFGRKFGVRLWSILLWGAMALICSAGAGGVFPKTTLFAMVMAIPIFLITRNAETKTRQLQGVITRCRFTILSQVGTWLLLTAGFLMARAL